MFNVAQQYITHKLKQLTIEDLMYYSQTYNIPISYEEAGKITKALKHSKENPFDPDGRKRMLRQLASITSKETAHSVNILLHRLAKQYGVEDWLY
ncbi:DUF2624 domain-containing protein [Halobacillus sp. Marseille-Q1614]|uniref:DUF2624 domain-containing protein n=1 Tax=Halobacillus sp. Marseille-Q1614 TaxID=2709134 RepID=UPI001570EF7F|nr:DUF2624 domain-containing protein [Halobacillus sp. Marseille-Q1614]